MGSTLHFRTRNPQFQSIVQFWFTHESLSLSLFTSKCLKEEKAFLPSRPSCNKAAELLIKKQEESLRESLNFIMTPTSQQQRSARPKKSSRVSSVLNVLPFKRTHYAKKSAANDASDSSGTAGFLDLPVNLMQQLLLLQASQTLTLL